MKKIQKCVDKNMILRYYIEADSQRGLTQVREDADCSLKTKQCNKKSCTHDFKPDVGHPGLYQDEFLNKICANKI